MNHGHVLNHYKNTGEESYMLEMGTICDEYQQQNCVKIPDYMLLTPNFGLTFF